MASLVYLDTNNERAADLAGAINQVRDGFATLKRLDGLRAQTVAVSPAEFGAQFGIADPAQAQAFSDRWTALMGGTYAGLPDFLDATVDGPGAGPADV